MSERRWTRGLPWVLGAFVFTLLGVVTTQEAGAAEAQVKRAQRGTVSFLAGDSALDAAYTTVDTTKSFLIVGGAASSNTKMEESLVGIRQLDQTSALISKGSGKAGAGDAKWQVVDFVQGVTVQKGASLFGAGDGTKIITLVSPVTKTKSFPIISRLSTGKNVFLDQCTASATLSNLVSGQWQDLTLTRGDTALSCLVEWQVITVDAANVYGGSFQMAAATGSVTRSAPTDFTAVTASKSFLVLSSFAAAAAANSAEQFYVRGEVTNGTTLTFTRGSTTNTADVSWYLVEMTDGTSVQRGTATLAAAAASTSVTLPTTVPAAESFSLISVSSADGTIANSIELTHELATTTSTTLTFTRSGTTGAITIAWQVMTLPPIAVNRPNGGEIFKVGDPENITWASSASTAADVKIEYSTDAANTTWTAVQESEGTLNDGIVTNDGTFSWTVPDAISGTCKIRITDAPGGVPDATRRDSSNATFSIIGIVTLTAPNSGVTLLVGDPYTITWTKTGTFASDFELRYSTNSGGDSYPTVIASNLTQVASCTGGSCSYAWPSVANVIGTQFRVKVVVMSDPTNFFDPSDGDNTVKGKLTVTAHNGGAPDWPTQTDQSITWTQTGTMSSYDLSYSTNSGGAFPNVIETGELCAGGTGPGTCSCTAGTCTYTWTVPNAAVSDFAQLKVIGNQAAGLTTADTSNADFKIVPSLRITSPNTGSEVWKVGEGTNAITWVVNGSIGTVKLEYSTNGFADELQNFTIIASTSADPAPVDGTGTYTWPSIPDAIGDTIKVRISDTAGAAPPGAGSRYDVSDNAFKIRGQISVTAPNGTHINNSALRVSSSTIPSTFDIAWTRQGAFGNVDIHYNVTGCGTSYPVGNAIATNLATPSPFTWTIPNDISTTACVRVRANNATYQTDTYGESPANFHIKGALDVTFPDGSNVLGSGVNQTITWNKAGTFTNVSVEYTSDNLNYSTIIASTTAETDPPTGTNNGQYGPWAPTVVDNRYKVRICQVGEANNCNTSGGTFEVKGALTNIAPDSTQYWMVGEQKNITWTSAPVDQGNVRIVYSLDGVAYPESAPDQKVTPTDVNSGTSPYLWTVPTGAIGETVYFRIYRVLDPTGTKIESTTAIKVYNLAIDAPTASEILRIGGTKLIQWTKTGAFSAPSANLKVIVSTNGVDFPDPANVISTTTGSSFNWTSIPAAFRSNTAKIRVEWQGSTNVKKDVAVLIKPSVDLTAPNGGGPYGAGTLLPITFTHTGDAADNWRLLYSTNGGDAGGGTYLNPANVITTLTCAAPPCTHNWTMPGTLLSNNMRVKVELVGDEANVKDESVSVFEVKGSLTTIAPNTTQYWMVGQLKNISWVSNPTDQGNVRIVYSLDGTAYPETTPDQKVTPVDVNSSTSPYSWTVPSAAIGETVYFRVYRVLDPTVKVESTTAIKIYNLSVNALPAILRVGGNQTVQWVKTGSFTSPSAEFKVYLSTDGTTFLTELTGPPLPTGTTFGWNNIAASARSETVKVRVVWQGETNIKAESNQVAVKPDVNLTDPDGGGPYGAGTTRAIAFTHTGTGSDTWKILYSLNGGDAGGGTYPVGQAIATLTSSAVTPLNSNTITCTSLVSPVACTWTIPSSSTVLSNTVRIKVELVGDEANVKDESLNAFAIKGSLSGIAPNTTQYWKVGELKNITWTSGPADQGNVRIVYSLDGTAYPESTPDQKVTPVDVNSSTSPYAWTVPSAALGETVYFRIYRVLDPTVKIDSTTPIKIYDLSIGALPAILRVGANQVVSWTKTGSFTSPSAEFKVLVSTDGTSFPNEVTGLPLPTGTSFNWNNIADALRSNTAKVKVQWQGSTNIESISPQIAIKPDVSLTSPNSGTYAIDDVVPVNFTHTGRATDTFRVAYSTDGGDAGGGTYPVGNVIATVTSGTVTPQNSHTFTCTSSASPVACSWTIPNIAGIVDTDIKVRVEQIGDESNVKDESTSNVVFRGKLTVTAPTSASTVWKVGDTTRAITWTSKGLTNVRIDYSKNDGGDGYAGTIVASTGAAAGTYTWNPAGPPVGIPLSATSDQFKIRVKAADATDSATEHFSALFSVVPKLTLTYPTGGETLIVYALSSAAARTITWTRSGDSRNTNDDFVDIYYTKDTTGDTDSDGIPDPLEANWIAIATGVNAPLSSANQYTWASVANDVTTNARIVLRLKSDSKTKSIPSGFTRIRADVVVDQPTAAALELGANTDYLIKWTPTGTFPGGTTVALEWTTDDFATIINAVTGPAAESAATLAVGADGFQQQFNWRVPSSLTSTGKVRVRVNGDTISAKSLNTFTIKGSLTGISPNTTQYWMVGETNHSIDWTSVPADQGDVKVVWSFDGTNFPEPGQLQATVNSTLHPYSFTITAAHKGENVTWRVYRVLDANVKVTSATPVKIYNLLLNQPTASEILRIGTAKTIQWTKDAGAFTTPSAEFAVYKSIDGAGFVEVTNPAARPTGTSFSYTPADADRSNNVKFRVEWQGSTNVKVDSPQVSVRPMLNLTSPDSGTYSVDGSVPVTFSHTGRTGPSGDTWEIYYSTNGGDAGGGTYPLANKIHTTAIGPASPYTYNWTVPDSAGIVGSNVRFKVVMVGDETNVKDESVGTITLRGKLTVNYPTSISTVWRVGESRTITWTAKQLTSVRIDYTKNNGGDLYGNVITASTGAAGGSYIWNPAGPPAGIPSTATSDQFIIRVKAIDAADSATEAFSAMFSVVPKLTLTYPTGGETMLVYALSPVADRKITWTRSGDSRNVNDDSVEIYYTKDTTADTDSDGIPDPPEGTWVAIATGAGAPLSSTGEYTWASVANDVSTTARIVLRLKSDSKTKDIKTSFSRIRADVKLDTPGEATGQSYGVGTDKVVKWTPTGTFPGGTNVALEWSRDNFVADINTCMGPPPTPPSGGSLPVGADGFQQSFVWRIPNNTSTTVKVRVRVIGDTIEHKSPNNFALTGSLFVDVPNGPATAWVPGDAESIQWHQLGGITTIDIYYSKNNGIDGYPYVVKLTQAAGPEAGSSVAWPGGVPNEVTADTYKIKIIDADNPGVSDVSDAGFIIKAGISGVTPGGSSAEFVGDPLTVSWTETGQPGPVTIELSRNGFTDETQNVPITSGYTHGALVQYVVPGGVLDALSETVKYRVKSEQANAALVASGVSTSNHPIRGKITINALPTLILGDTANVTWSRSGTIGSVKVEYFDGTSWSTLTTTAPQNGPYGFSMTTPTINETATNGAMVRVSDADRPEVISTSVAFLVKPLLTLTSPTNLAARVYNVGQNIAWTKRGSNVLNVKLEYFNGSVWADLFSGTTSNDSSESWTAPDNVSNLFNKQIRISSLPAVDPWAVTNPQNGNFKITGTVAITSPIATDKWVAGSTNNIKWSKTGTGLTAIRLDYTTDNWNSSGTIVASYDATLGATGYPWPIPLTAVTDNAIIKISDANDASVEAFSPAGFKIVPGFTVTRPIISERVTVKQNYQIQWDRNGTGTPNTVNLYYSTNGGGGWTSIAPDQINSGTYDWPVPDFTGLPNANAMVKVEWTGDAGANDESPLFKLVAGFTVTSPNSTADKWDVGEVNKPITWTCTSANIPKAKIEYSTNGGSSFDYTIASEADNTGLANAGRTYLWPAVDDTITSQFIVRVSQPFVTAVQAADIDFANGAGDVSNANAKIKMFTKVLTPNASGIELIKYDAVNNPATYNITWTTTGTGSTTTNVKLLYSKDDFATPGIAIMDGAMDYTLNDNTFLWQVPDDITTTATVKVRVQSWTDLDAKDDSDNAFKIKGDYLISSPVDGSAFKIYHATQNPNPHSITWTTVGGGGATMGTVNLIAYSTDPVDPYFRDGSNNVYTLANPLAIVTGYTNNPNASTTYSWQVPDKASPTVKVRVVNPADTTVVKDSAGTFRIEGAVTITYPTAAGLTLTVGSPETITWNKTGSSVSRVKVSYSINGLAGPWTPILETEEGVNDDGIVTNNGDIPWTVPDLLALAPAGMPRENVMIKVEDPTNSNVSDPSDNAFKVKGNLVFVTPAAATPQTRWVTNESRIVSWTTTGSIAATDLVYTKNNFSNTTPVVSNYTNSIGLNTYSWTIPNDQSATVKLRLSDKNDGSNVSIDSAQFTVDLYNITFELRDLLSNNHITGASVNGSSTTGGYTWVSSVSSPITKGLQAGTWSVTFTKSEYADMGTTVVVDSDKTVVLYGETKVVHVWESITEIAYNTTTDTATVSSTLRRDGIVVVGATSCTINIYDGTTLIKNFTQATAPDANGFYSFTWVAPTGLVSGKVYNVVTTIVNATGGSINTPSTFSITQVKKLQEVQDTVNAKLDTTLSQVRNDISDAVEDRLGFTAADVAAGKTMKSELAAQTGAIDTKLASFETKTDTQIAALKAGAADIKIAAGNVELKGEDLEATNLKFAGRLMMPATVLLNDKNVVLQYKAIAGIVPLITITTLTTAGKEETVVKALPMARNKDRDDMYEYTIDKVTSPPYTPGKFVTVLVEAETFTHKLQPSKGKIKNVEVGSFIVESTTLSTLEGLVAGSSGVKNLVVDALTVLRGMQSSGNTGNMIGLLETLNRKVDALPSQIAQQLSQQGDMVQMKNTLNEVATQIRSLAGDEMGVDFSQLIGKALSESDSITDIRRKADAVQGTTEVMQVLMEQKLGGVDAPVVHVVYQ